jgi:hypothetical protein
MMAAIIALPFVVLLVGGANMAVRLTTPRMVQYDHRYVRLASVSPQFADWMGKLEGTATGGTGYANPAGYGAYPQPAARTNPMVFVYAGGGVALMLFLMMCGGVGLVWMSSFARDRERAAMQRRAQQVHQDAMDEHQRMIAEMNAQHERAFSRPVSSLPPPPPRQTASSATTTTPNPAPPPPPLPPRGPDSSSAADAADLASNSGFPADPAAFSPEAVIGFPPTNGPGSSRPPFPSGSGRSTRTPGFELTASSDVQAGDRIFIQWGSQWFPGKVVETSATQIKVHYDQYDATWDEWAAPNRVRAARSATPGRFSRTPPATTAATPAPAASSQPAAASKLRTWSDASGKFKIEAEMIRLEKGEVQLKKADGTTVAVPLDKLSQADQEFAIQQP